MFVVNVFLNVYEPVKVTLQHLMEGINRIQECRGYCSNRECRQCNMLIHCMVAYLDASGSLGFWT